MNTVYRIVWNVVSCRWVVASEFAKGRKKAARRAAGGASRQIGLRWALPTALISIVAAQGVSAADLVTSALFNNEQDPICMGVQDNGTSVIGGTTNDVRCTLKLGNTGTAASLGFAPAGGMGLNFVSNSNGAFVNGGLEVFGTNAAAGSPIAYIHGGLSLFSNATSGTASKITGLAAGNVNSTSTDGVNGSQLFGLANSTAAAMGAGSAVNADGTISKPSFPLANANSILGLSGAATDVGSAFGKVDSALGSLNAFQTNINNGAGIKYFHTNSLVDDSTATGRDSTAIGPLANASQLNALAAGSGANALGQNAVAVGPAASATANQSTALGNNAQAMGTGDLALGYSSTANGAGSYATAVGSNARAIGGNAAALGSGAVASGKKSVALGAVAAASADNSVALGASSTTTADLTKPGYNPGAGALSGTASTTNGEVSLGSAGKERRLTNLAAGSSATDAVNVSQLQSEDAKVNSQGTSTASALGGGASYNSTSGTVSAPSYALTNANSIGGTTGAAADVGSAFTKVDGALGKLNTAVTQNTTDIAGNTTSINNINTQITNGTIGLVQQAAAGAELTVGKDTDGAAVNFADKNGGTRTLNNVTAGIADTDAVNVSQLNASKTRYYSVNDNGVQGGNYANDGATGVNALAAGVSAAAAGSSAVAIGDEAMAAGNGSVAIGGAAESQGKSSVAVGANTQALGSQALSLGFNAQSKADKSTAIGAGAQANNAGDVALGQGSVTAAAVGTSSASIGGVNYSFAGTSPTSTVSVGSNGNERTVTNVAAGRLSGVSTDAVNGSQLYATNQQVTQNTTDIAGNTTAISNLDGRVTTNEGDIANINSSITTMNGQLADAVKYDSAAHDKVTLGNAGTPVQVSNVKNGALSASSSDAVNGSQLYATNQQVAQNTTDIAGNTTAINNINTQINSGTIGLVQQAAAGANLTVGKDTDGAAVDFAGTAGARKLVNVADGTVAANSKDAVNGGQLYTTNQNVAQNTTDIAGNTTAISNLDGRVTTNEGDIANINSSITTMNGQLADAVKYDSAAHDKVTLGNAGTPVQVSNVKDGALSASSSDAVNGSQLYATNQQVAQNTTDIAGNTTAINNINTQINSGTIGLVQQAAAGANLTVGKDTDGAAVDFAGTAGARKLVNVADGTVAASSKDAVNGGQLYGVSQSVANAIGGGSTVNTDGSISAPSYEVHNADGSTTTVNNAGDAITNLDGRVTQNTSDISSINTTINNMGGQLADAVKYDSAAHDKVTLGNAGTAVQVSNVKDGELSATSSDAVNGSQLYATNQQVAQNTSDISNINSTINNMNTAGLKYVQVNSTAAAANAAGSESVAIGGNTNASAANAVAVGGNAQASAANSVALGANSVADRENSVSVGSAGNERQVTNVAAGNLSSTSTDAVNGSQLYATNQAVSSLDNRVTNVETTVNSMAGAVSNVTNITNGQAGMFQVSKDSNGTQPTASGSKATAGGNGAVASGNGSTALGNGATASADNSVALGANSVADRSNTVSVGSAGQERQVTNVAAGTANTDAVNVGQLKAAGVMNNDGTTNAVVAYDRNSDGSSSVTLNGGADGTTIHNVAAGTAATDAANVGQLQQAADWSKSYTDRAVQNMGRQASGGVASAMAMASIPQAVANGQNSIGAGVGTFRGQSSVAVGMSAMSASGKFAVKFNASATTKGDAGVGVGASYLW